MSETETRPRRLPHEIETLTIFLEMRPRRDVSTYETLVRLETVSRPRRRDRDHNPSNSKVAETKSSDRVLQMVYSLSSNFTYLLVAVLINRLSSITGVETNQIL